MGVFRTAVAAVLILATAATVEGQCASEVRTISTRHSVPNLVAGASAWGGGVLGVAKFDRAERRIFLATYDHNFNHLTADTLITGDTADGALFLLWNGVDFGMFYRTEGVQRLVMQRIAKSGVPIGGPIPVSTRTIDVTEEIDVTWSSALNAYAIATTYEPRSATDVWITIMNREGVVQRDVPTNVFATKDVVYLNVAVTDDGVVGVFYLSETDESVLFARLAEAAGAPVDTVWTRGRDLDVVASGNNFYLIKTIDVGGKSEIHWLVVNSAGTIVAPDRLLLRGSELHVRPLSLIANDNELALAYLDAATGFELEPGEMRLHRFTTAGDVVTNSLFAAADPVHRFAVATHDIIWTGTAYVTTAIFEFDRDLSSLLLRLCPLRVTITANDTSITTRDTVTYTAVVEGGVAPFTYEWDMGDRSPPRRSQVVRHQYNHNGTYEITVTVMDDAGAVTTATLVVRVGEGKRRVVRK